MKKTILSLLFIFIAAIAFAQSDRVGWAAVVKVVDETGLPISNATVAVWYYVTPPPGESEASAKIEGQTDANGIFATSNATNGSISLGFFASKNGYYSANTGHEFDRFRDDDPEKWNPHTTLLLNKIENPIPMYAKKLNSLVVPKPNQAIGYDLMAGDWIAPFGKGVIADLYFREEHPNPQSGYILSISFPNQGDGIQEFTVPDAQKGSHLRSGYTAPLDGYQAEVKQTKMTNPDRIFYFRVRTVLDDAGNIKSALYGKIYGDLAQFTYYLNPTPNDRNVEFDANHNLLSGLQSFEKVVRP